MVFDVSHHSQMNDLFAALLIQLNKTIVFHCLSNENHFTGQNLIQVKFFNVDWFSISLIVSFPWLFMN